MQFVTIGGVTVGLCILAHYIVTWWPGSKSLRGNPLHYAADLAPFLVAWAYGVLTILGVGGLIGWIADTTLGISDWLGNAALVWGMGGQAGQALARTTYLPLTQTGGAIVLILTVVLVAVAKKSRYGSDIKRGAWCGICLGTSADIAGFAAAPLAVAVNWLGDNVYGAL